VGHQPYDVGQRARDLDLGRTDQRNVVEAELAGCQGRKLGRQIGRGREDHADHVVGGEVVAPHHLGHQLGDPGQDRVTVVALDLDRTADRPHHGRSSISLTPGHPNG
jgi:hypothetical protein